MQVGLIYFTPKVISGENVFITKYYNMIKLTIILFNNKNNLYFHFNPKELKYNSINILAIIFLTMIVLFPYFS